MSLTRFKMPTLADKLEAEKPVKKVEKNPKLKVEKESKKSNKKKKYE